MNTEFHTAFERVRMFITRNADVYKTWIEGTYMYDIPNKNPNFFVTTEPNRIGFSPKCR